MTVQVKLFYGNDLGGGGSDVCGGKQFETHKNCLPRENEMSGDNRKVRDYR